jgi:hypothetical protein
MQQVFFFSRPHLQRQLPFTPFLWFFFFFFFFFCYDETSFLFYLTEYELSVLAECRIQVPYMNCFEYCGVHEASAKMVYIGFGVLVRVYRRTEIIDEWTLVRSRSWYAYTLLPEGHHMRSRRKLAECRWSWRDEIACVVLLLLISLSIPSVSSKARKLIWAQCYDLFHVPHSLKDQSTYLRLVLSSLPDVQQDITMRAADIFDNHLTARLSDKAHHCQIPALRIQALFWVVLALFLTLRHVEWRSNCSFVSCTWNLLPFVLFKAPALIFKFLIDHELLHV